MYDRYAEILLQQLDDRQHAPAGAEQIDRVGLAMLEEGLLDVSIDLLGRELPDLVEIDLDAFHAEHIEAGLDEIFGEQVIDAADKVGRAQDRLRLERMQRPHM